MPGLYRYIGGDQLKFVPGLPMDDIPEDVWDAHPDGKAKATGLADHVYEYVSPQKLAGEARKAEAEAQPKKAPPRKRKPAAKPTPVAATPPESPPDQPAEQVTTEETPPTSGVSSFQPEE